jgi:SAM-dependent methyltransferase
MDTPTAISEAWRLLKPGAYLVAAWNDRDLRHPAIQELEAVLEHRVKGYSRHQKQRCVESWNDTLQAGGMFRYVEGIGPEYLLLLKGTMSSEI